MRTIIDRLFLVLMTIAIGLVVAVPRLLNCACNSGIEEALADESRIHNDERFVIDKVPEIPQIQIDPERQRQLDIEVEKTHRINALVLNIRKINKEVPSSRAVQIANEIIEQSDFVDPPIHENLVASIIARESFFSLDVQQGIRRGSRGELGLMQIHPGNKRTIAAVIDNEEDRECVLTDIRCNIMSGVTWLDYVRNLCDSDDVWIWMAAYQMKACPSARSARNFKGAKLARSYFCQITPGCDQIWPM